MNLIESYCKHKYYNLSNSEKILKKIQEKIDSSRTGGADIFLDCFMLLIQDYACTPPDSYSPAIV